jgi:inward rectifier potassium channel
MPAVDEGPRSSPRSVDPARKLVPQTRDPRARMPTIIARGRRLAPYEDFYHWVLKLTWAQFFGAVAIAFALVNALFALAYAASPGCVANATSYEDDFFFSVQTLATIGYGTMAPLTRYGHLLVSAEALVGLMTTALVTGITFVRFARPTARVLFCDKAVIAPRDGVPHLMFRLANWRRNQIVEAQLSVLVLVTETTREGDAMRRPIPIPLVRSTNSMFALTWTAMHRIDEGSVFHGPEAMERLRALNAEIFLSVTGFDETLAQTIHARFRYALEDVVPNARFADVLTTSDAEVRTIDFDRFHDIVPAEEAS